MAIKGVAYIKIALGQSAGLLRIQLSSGKLLLIIARKAIEQRNDGGGVPPTKDTGK